MRFQICMTRNVVDSLNYNFIVNYFNYKTVVKTDIHIQQLNTHYLTRTPSSFAKVSHENFLIILFLKIRVARKTSASTTFGRLSEFDTANRIFGFGIK